MDDIGDCIREMISEEKDAARSRTKQKGSRELVNLASSINYDCLGGDRNAWELNWWINEIGLFECSRDEFSRKRAVIKVVKSSKTEFLFL